MLEDLYSIYLPRKSHPWCYISLEINPSNIDVNVHPTKHEVRFLHEETIIEKVKDALDAKLVGNNASRTFYAQARLPQVDITKKVLEEVLPEYNTSNKDKTAHVYAHQMVRTDSTDQKLEKFNFTVNSSTANQSKDLNETNERKSSGVPSNGSDSRAKITEKVTETSEKSTLMDDTLPQTSTQVEKASDMMINDSEISEIGDNDDDEVGSVAERAFKRVYQYLGNRDNIDYVKTMIDPSSQESSDNGGKNVVSEVADDDNNDTAEGSPSKIIKSKPPKPEFKSYSVNGTRREVKLTSVLKLRKNVEDNYHEGLRDILSNMIFVGCVDDTFALVQSGLNLYICNTPKLVLVFLHYCFIFVFLCCFLVFVS